MCLASLQTLRGDAVILRNEDGSTNITLEEVFTWGLKDVLELFSRVCANPQKWRLTDDEATIVRDCVDRLKVHLDNGRYSFWWKASPDGQDGQDGSIDHFDARFETTVLRAVCTSDLFLIILSYLAHPGETSNRDNFYLPFLVGATRMVSYAWRGEIKHGPFMISILFSKPGSAIIRPLLGVSCPSRCHPLDPEPQVTAERQKELCQVARKNYLESVGGYDLSRFPNPQPSPNVVGNCAETWGHTILRQSVVHREGQLGGISARVQPLSSLQNVLGFKNNWLKAPCENCSHFIGTLNGKSLVSFR